MPGVFGEAELEYDTSFIFMILSFTNRRFMGNPGLLFKQCANGKYVRVTAILVKPRACGRWRAVGGDHPEHSDVTEEMNGYISTLPISEVEIV